jgi:hypothetical protein
VLPALKVTDVPLPEIEPNAFLVRAQEYEIPDGQAELHSGVAVIVAFPP